MIFENHASPIVMKVHHFQSLHQLLTFLVRRNVLTNYQKVVNAQNVLGNKPHNTDEPCFLLQEL